MNRDKPLNIPPRRPYTVQCRECKFAKPITHEAFVDFTKCRVNAKTYSSNLPRYCVTFREKTK